MFSWLRKRDGGSSILVRSLTYRVAVIAADAVLLFIIFGDPVEAGAITLLRHAIQTVLFAAHAYAWDQSTWSRGMLGGQTRRRSVIKAILFRSIAIVNDMLILTFIAGQALTPATLTTAAIAVTNTTIYYIHDRLLPGRRRS